MNTFVLVHGSHGGGLAAPGRRPGLHPHLTGLSDRAHLLSCAVDLTIHITDIVNLLFYEDLSDVVLVGNSYGGMVITGVAAQTPERLKPLVYLDAYLPDGGQPPRWTHAPLHFQPTVSFPRGAKELITKGA